MGLVGVVAGYLFPPNRLKGNIGCIQRWFGKVSADLLCIVSRHAWMSYTRTHLVVRSECALVLFL